MGQKLSPEIVCQYIQNALVDNKVGSYFGESKDGIPHGRGIFITWENKLPREIILQSFFEGSSRTDGCYISLDPVYGSFIVMNRVIKNGIAYDSG